MSYTLLYASHCQSCSHVADSVASLNIPGLDVAPLSAAATARGRKSR